ncbi:hypothetical protein TTHERM_001311292 (macronuclear) [Tetrahymena thermophila SB210]|uniref:Uncharacterized protein n=1 Tax=Tetrahymena thermophila (strain SB210) TaxID=312017 RepID=W7X4G7_TETTS|nr:hypothetical protein TTHERM_001311292 [Tetrahymena thermophila SB210]EWS71288.1 hypothetical protein TTHERM_001311292 [Tetrahymena thermophila SB210]|eukprot:XP_012656180.1 hypothetical protein TTHERM_001311292 [Tetrahymena thermophila SB210]
MHSEYILEFLNIMSFIEKKPFITPVLKAQSSLLYVVYALYTEEQQLILRYLHQILSITFSE